MNIKKNCDRAGCRDVFKSFLVKNADYEGTLEIPIIKTIRDVPNKIISFKDALLTKDYNQWIHFYIDDFHFEKVWSRINQYVKIFKKFNGVILPDFSVYRDMPLVMQYWNIYRSRAIGTYLQSQGIKVIVNIRYGDERTYDVACLGAPKKSIIAIGTNGCVKNVTDRKYTEDGFKYIIDKLSPIKIVIYGSITKEIQKVCDKNNIQIINFRNDQFDKNGGR